MDVGRTVGGPELDGLGVVGKLPDGSLLRVGVAEHAVVEVLPAERHPHQHGTVAVPPTDGGGGLLVRNESQEGRGDRVAEGREGSGV